MEAKLYVIVIDILDTGENILERGPAKMGLHELCSLHTSCKTGGNLST